MYFFLTAAVPGPTVSPGRIASDNQRKSAAVNADTRVTRFGSNYGRLPARLPRRPELLEWELPVYDALYAYCQSLEERKPMP